jgi:nucleoside-diphosphate-sugar epimerase
VGGPAEARLARCPAPDHPGIRPDTIGGAPEQGERFQMNEKNVALIVGATGLSGSYTGRHLKDKGWTVMTVSRSAADLPWSDRHIAADLENGAKSKAALAPTKDVTHVFFCTWSRQANEAENVRVNAGMVRNLFEGIADAPVKHAALVTGLKHYLGSFDDYAKVKPYTPFLESSPRLPGLNFYYAQEDVVFEMAAKRGFSWSVHRPHTMIGFVVGNLMNMAVTLAVYASICKHTGRPFVYPGSPEQYNAVTDVTDARILAEQLYWAVTTPEAANMAFNIVNGDVFRWTWLWQQIADYFGIKVGEYPGHPVPLEKQMVDAPGIWSEIVAKHGLQDIPVSRLASWWHSDADLGRTLECFTDMTNSRRLGFSAYQQTTRSFFDVFDELRERRIIPA